MFLRKYINLLLIFFCLISSGNLNAQENQKQIQNINAIDYLLQKRKPAEKFGKISFSDHMFISVGIAPEYIIGRGATGSDILGMKGSISLGKWFSPVQGFRLGINSGRLLMNDLADITKVGVTADYLMNISAFANRYKENRLFEVIGIVGLGYNMTFNLGQRLHSVGLQAGLQGKFNVAPQLDLFVEPMFGLVTDNYNATTSWRRYDLSGSVMFGLNYKVRSNIVRKTRNETFENPSFIDNTFISFGLGAQTLLSDRVSRLKIVDRFGPNTGIYMGKWLSSHSGLRLGMSGGFSNWNIVGSQYRRLKNVAVQLDYLYNMTAAFEGYSRNRIFEMLIVAGVNGSYVDKSGKTTITPGVGVGLQSVFRLNEALDLFIEPRLDIYTNRFAGGETSSKIDALANVNVGLTYNMTTRQKRKAAPRFVNSDVSENVFVSLGGGANMLVMRQSTSLALTQRIAPQATLSLGKWFSATSGIRLQAEVGLLTSGFSSQNHTRSKMVAGGFDYLWNITSAFSAYNPDRLFDLIGIVGVNMAVPSNGTGVFFGGNVGLQLNCNVTQSWGVYLEPRLDLYSNKFAYGNLIGNIDALMSLSAGVSYKLKGYDKRQNHAMFEDGTRKNWFFSFSGGGSAKVNSDIVRVIQDHRVGYNGRISFGKWYTPLSGWRVSLSGEYLPDHSSNKISVFTLYSGLSLDYMMNLSTLTVGYNTDRWFDLIGFLGVSGGASASAHKRINGYNGPITGRAGLSFTPGIAAGIQTNFNIGSSLGLFIEPRITLYGGSYDEIESTKSNVVASLSAGLVYKLGSNKPKERPAQFSGASWGENTFASVGFGSGLFASTITSSTPLSKKLMFNADVNVGKWFTSVSGVRVGLSTSSFDLGNNQSSRFGFTIIDIHADYLCNLTNLISGYKEDRLFHLLAIAGIGGAFPVGIDDAKNTLTGHVGIQGTIRVNDHFNIYLEPRINAFGDQIDKRNITIKMDGTAVLMLGTTYNF